ncbi:MAG: hypothetical protein WC231_01305 [Dehalococcoidales bacterium]
MNNSWKSSYQSLIGFINSNPSIKIEPSKTSIPSEVRPVFYALFDKARESYIREYFSDELAAAIKLSEAYTSLTEDIVSVANLEPEIDLNQKLTWLIENPMNGLMRFIYNPLMDFLKGKLDEDEFRERSEFEFISAFKDQYKKGYILWAILALFKLLEPNNLTWVSQKEPNGILSLKELYKQGARVESVPAITKTSKLTFEPGTWDTFIVPDLIVYSAKLKKYVAIRRSLPVNTDEPYLVAKQKTTEREWASYQQLSNIFNLSNHWPDILIYCDEKLENLNLIADYNHMLHPDMVVGVIPQFFSFDSAEINRTHTYREYLEPFKGTTILFQDDIPNAVTKAFPPSESTTSKDQTDTIDSNVFLITSEGFNLQKLGPILEYLM